MLFIWPAVLLVLWPADVLSARIIIIITRRMAKPSVNPPRILLF